SGMTHLAATCSNTFRTPSTGIWIQERLSLEVPQAQHRNTPTAARTSAARQTATLRILLRRKTTITQRKITAVAVLRFRDLPLRAARVQVGLVLKWSLTSYERRRPTARRSATPRRDHPSARRQAAR